MPLIRRQFPPLFLLLFTALLCVTAFRTVPRCFASALDEADSFVLLSDGTQRTISEPAVDAPAATVHTPRIAAVEAAVAQAEGVTLGDQGVAVYAAPLTVTAADFSDYRRADAGNLTDGATVTYSTLIPLEVTGLQAGIRSGETNYQILEGVMDLVASFTVKQAAAYRDVMFKVTLPPGIYYLNYYDTDREDSQCLHIYQNTWLSMEGVTIRKADVSCGSMLRNCLGNLDYTGYNGNSNFILEGGVWDVQSDHFSPHSTTDRFSSLRLGHGANILIAHVTFLGSVNGHHLELCGIKGCSVVNCTFRGYLDTDYRGNYDYKEAIQIDVVNNDEIAPAFSCYDDTVSQDVVIYGSTFRNLCRGIGGHNAVYGVYYTNVVVQNNTFSHLSGEAFYGLNYCRTLIDRNTMVQVGAGVLLYALTPQADGNYFPTWNHTLPPLYAVERKNTNVMVSHNDIQVSAFSQLSWSGGILVYGCPYSGTVCRTRYGGSTFWIRGVTVSDNRIRGARDADISLHCACDSTVSGNQIESISQGNATTAGGIHLAKTDASVTVTDNQIAYRKKKIPTFFLWRGL